MISYPNVKLNLGLNVLRRRPDGYHDLETLFVPYPDMTDTLEIIHADDFSRTSATIRNLGPKMADFVPKCLEKTNLGTNKPLFVPKPVVQGITEDAKVMITIARKEGVDWDPLKDLTVKAYQLLAEDFKLPPVKIYLQKNAPVGAGLGGGSADCAFALKMLSEIAELHLSDAQLASYAARLGSDCAFFIYDRPMFGEGRGEMLTTWENPDLLKGYRIELVVPEDVAVSTADAYRGIVPAVPQVPLKDVLRKPIEAWKDLLVNDFEKTVFAKYPILAQKKQELYDRGAVYAAMSGSGSALFGLF